MPVNPYLQEILEYINNVPPVTSVQRKASKHVYSFSKRSFAEQLKIWDAIWKNSDSFWIRVHAYFFLERNMKDPEALKQMWPIVMKWQNDIDDWGLCDALAKIFTNIMIVLPDEVYYQLKKWNRNKNQWKRRQSVVTLLYYSRTKKKHPPFKKIIELITPLLDDKEYYVQKGVGWTLRELYSVYPEQAFLFFEKNNKRISSLAFSIAIEKLNTAEKNKLKKVRKKN